MDNLHDLYDESGPVFIQCRRIIIFKLLLFSVTNSVSVSLRLALHGLFIRVAYLQPDLSLPRWPVVPNAQRNHVDLTYIYKLYLSVRNI